MAIRSDDDVVQVTVHGTADGQAVKNVFHYVPRTEGDDFEDNLDNFLEKFRTKWRDGVLASLSDSYKVLRYSAIVIQGSHTNAENPSVKELTLGDTSDLDGDAEDDVGEAAGAALPTFVALTIQKKTGKAGRSNHGSCRLGPYPETFTEATAQNTWTATGLTAGENAANALRAILDGLALADTYVPVIFSKKKLFKKAQPAMDVTDCYTVWTERVVNQYVSTQKSRQRRSTLGA